MKTDGLIGKSFAGLGSTKHCYVTEVSTNSDWDNVAKGKEYTRVYITAILERANYSEILLYLLMPILFEASCFYALNVAENAAGFFELVALFCLAIVAILFTIPERLFVFTLTHKINVISLSACMISFFMYGTGLSIVIEWIIVGFIILIQFILILSHYRKFKIHDKNMNYVLRCGKYSTIDFYL